MEKSNLVNPPPSEEPQGEAPPESQRAMPDETALLSPGTAPSPTAPPESSRPSPGRPIGALGDYELIEEIGRGSMGVVYKARQKKLERYVALKMLIASHWAKPEEIDRFRAEAHAAAGILHPNLVKVFDVGEANGLHYFVMEYIVGNSLSRLLEEKRLGLEERVRILVQVVRAVDHLHRNGIVHRDLKPSNILVDASGRSYVTDFGLAKIIGKKDLTRTGAILGTPYYMSPEQASGETEKIDSRSDIYSLGAILYELLTGSSPFSAQSPLEIIVQVLEREPPRPRRIAPEIHGDLELICLKCLEKSPAKRYSSAAALADDLERYLRREPVEAYPARMLTGLARAARRNPALAIRLFGLALFYSVQLANYHVFHIIDLRLHLELTGVLIAWMLASLGFQNLLKKGFGQNFCTMAWGAVDVISVSAVLLLLKGVISPLIVAYPLLIAASGFWFRAGFVWLMTGASILSYSILIADHHLWRPGRVLPDFEISHDRHVFFILMLFLIGAITANQVYRLRSLNRFISSK